MGAGPHLRKAGRQDRPFEKMPELCQALGSFAALAIADCRRKYFLRQMAALAPARRVSIGLLARGPLLPAARRRYPDLTAFWAGRWTTDPRMAMTETSGGRRP